MPLIKTGPLMNAIVKSDEASLCEVEGNPMPAGGRAGYMTTPDNVRIRYAIWRNAEPGHKGTVCLVQGRAEFIEKYFETVADLLARGFSVATFDFRGQGGSDRLIDPPTRGYVDRLEDYWTDLNSFHKDILLPECLPPFYLVGHSTGGLVALMAAVRDRMMFDRMFLSSPLLGVEGMPFSMASMASIAELLCYAGLGHMPVGRKQDEMPSEANFAGNKQTSDYARYMRMVDTLKKRPDLAVGRPTLRWTAAAFRAVARANADDFPARINVPVLMMAAARDEIASTPAIESLGLRLRIGRHAVIANARHELFMENDDVRGQVFAAFDAFITEQSE